MAPSRDTSYKVYTPLVPPTPVRIVTDLLVDATQPAINPSNENSSQREPLQLTQPVRIALPQLASSGAAFLTSQSPIKSSSILPEMPTAEISPIKSRTRSEKNSNLLTVGVKTGLEKQFQEALVVKDAEINFLKGYIMQLQSQMVLQRVYCGRVCRQLMAKEDKAAKKGKKGGRIAGDGAPRLLTGSAFFKLVADHEAAKEAEAVEKDSRKQKKLEYTAQVAEWTRREGERGKRNEEGVVRWQAAVEDWNTRRQEAKAARLKVKEWEKENPKPKKTAPESFEKATPKPKMKKANDSDEDGQDSDWTDDSSDEDKA
ncbi:hypothetical protein FPV67DRAFT_1415819 [Lyophyllum atratum]|nr:hypothetical protein FPV67DRAFT_1415819 [Lyophyllum atratum]